MAKSPFLSRNDFVKFVVGVLGSIMGAIIGLPAVGYLISPAIKTRQLDAWVALGPLENYPIDIPTLFTFTRTKVNGWEKTVNSYGVYVLRKSDSVVEVYSNVCTHLSCRVTWDETRKEYLCPCHDAQFGIAGEVLGGPPPRPLDRYETRIEEGNIAIRLVEG